MTDLSVIIITWNSEDEISACVESVISNSEKIKPEIIIIDNNSSDSSFEIINKINYSNLHTYKNESNLGYTKAVNQGVRFSKGNFILLLNPDTVLGEGTLDKLSEFLQNNPAYDACAPKMLNHDGTVQHSIRNFPSYWDMFCQFSLLGYIFSGTKLFGHWKMKYFDYSDSADVNQPMAAALMMRSSAADKNNCMDERFEMFYNDVDLCKRIIDSGSKIRYISDAAVTHGHGVSVNKARIRMIKIWNKDCVKYFEKHHKNAFLLLWLKINLKISEILRILYYKLVIKN